MTAEDAAGNVGPVSNTASGTVADTSAPTAPAGLTANGGAGQAALSWTASTDNVGVSRYNVHRSTVAGFIASTSNRVAQPTGTTYTDTGLPAGTYFYKVIAETLPATSARLRTRRSRLSAHLLPPGWWPPTGSTWAAGRPPSTSPEAETSAR